MKTICLNLLLLLPVLSVRSQDATPPDTLTQKWLPVIRAIEQVESKGKDNLVSRNGRYVGCLQISPTLVRQCNIIVGSSKYTLRDRYSKEKSYEMFIVFQEHFNPDGDPEFAIRIWNSGDLKCMERKDRTEAYYQRVMRQFEKLAAEEQTQQAPSSEQE